MDDAVTEVVRVALGLGGPLGSDEEVGAALADAAEEGDLMLENDASDERVAVTVKLAGADGRVEPAVLAVGAGVDERNSVCDEAPEADFTEPLCAALALISADRERVDSCVGSAEPDADEVAVGCEEIEEKTEAVATDDAVAEATIVADRVGSALAVGGGAAGAAHTRSQRPLVSFHTERREQAARAACAATTHTPVDESMAAKPRAQPTARGAPPAGHPSAPKAAPPRHRT
jgi:hypothetical protein